MAFAHFGIHTEFSIIDSIVRIQDLAKQASEDGQVALAITDLSNLYATVKFYKACLGNGIKPIIGAEVYLDNANQTITLLASNQEGYRNLTNVVSLGFTDGQKFGKPITQRGWIFERNAGLIVLFTEKSDVGHAMLSSNVERTDELLQQWQAHFDDRLYFAIKRTQRPNEDRFIEQAIRLSNVYHIPIIAHNDVRFLHADDFDAHEARVCIANSQVLADPNRPHLYSAEQYLKTQAEMTELFSDMPAVIDNTIDLAKRCNVILTLGQNVLPEFPIPPEDTIETFFRRMSQEGLEKRLEKLYPVASRDENWADVRQPYDERLEFEINTILSMGFPGYFLIVMDFIRWAKANDVPVGPGRGSGAGSLVAYALNITDLDPLEYDLLFERFLNPERVSMPDFDVDFCIEGRDRVIDYVAQKYGREAVSQIITFGTMAAKAVIRDVARVQGKSYGLADKISKLIPKMNYDLKACRYGRKEKDAKDSLEPVREIVEILDNPNHPDHEDVNEIWEMAVKLEGITRNVGKHAGGVLIAPTKITDFSAIYCDDAGYRVSQFDKDDVEAVGLVKFDFLGLRNLTVIHSAIKNINTRRAKEGKKPLDLDELPLDDKPTYELLQKAFTTAVFQLESSGMKKYLAKLKPSNIEDVIAMCALYRPGPLGSGMVDMYIDRKHGVQEVVYDHERLEPVLSNTYGVIVYQEQVMQISQVMAGYTLGGADMLRRAMGKKMPEEMAKQRSIFIEGAIEQGIDEKLSGSIFDLMEKFAEYGFNKSHSAAYGVLAYQTAYLKHYYPAEFMSAVITSDMNNTDSVVFFINDCRENFKLVVENPCVNHSNWEFVPKNKKTIVYGLGGLKGVGKGAVESIVEARSNGGKFTDLFDFCRRVDIKKVNRRTLEALIRAGCFDVFAKDLRTDLPDNRAFDIRGSLLNILPQAMQSAEQQRSNHNLGMLDMFANIEEVSAPPPLPTEPIWTDKERLKFEKDTLGLYLTGHPIDDYRDELKQYCKSTLADLTENNYGETTWISGLIIDVANFGNRAVISLDDGTGRIEVSCFAERFNRLKEKLKLETVVMIEANVRKKDIETQDKGSSEKKEQFFASLQDVMTLTEARKRWLQKISVKIAGHNMTLFNELQALLPPIMTNQVNNDTDNYKGVPLNLFVYDEFAIVNVNMPEHWQIVPDDNTLNLLKMLVAPQDLRFHYS